MAFLGTFSRGMQKSIRGTAGFFRGSFQELKKVRWPTRQEIVSYTLVVMVTVLLLSLFFSLVDTGIGELVKIITKK